MKIETLREYKCPVCGKRYIPAPQHAYKDRRSPYNRVCSWKCVMESERLKATSAKAKGSRWINK